MVTPVLSDEQRAAAREKAAIARRQRRELLEQITMGRTSIAAVLARADTDPIVAKTPDPQRRQQAGIDHPVDRHRRDIPAPGPDTTAAGTAEELASATAMMSCRPPRHRPPFGWSNRHPKAGK